MESGQRNKEWVEEEEWLEAKGEGKNFWDVSRERVIAATTRKTR